MHRVKYPSMLRRGRVNWVVIAGGLSVALIVALVLTAQRGPVTTAGEFMEALAAGDAERLARLSIIGDDDYDTRLRKWRTTIDRAQHYLFAYTITNSKEAGDDQVTVTMQVVRNTTDRNAAQEKYEMTLRKRDGEWRVDVPSIARSMYPALPR